MKRTEPGRAKELLEAALCYASAGMQVLPLHHIKGGVCSCGKKDCSAGKHPMADCVPNGVLSATTNGTIIQEWWTKHPLANIGVRLAPLPSDPEFSLIAIDVDDGVRTRKDGTRVLKKGSKQLAALEVQNGPLLTPLVQQTGGGGRHFLFKVPVGVSLPGKLATDIEIKGPNSYVVVAPSNHESGGHYEWDTPLDAMDWILDLVPEAPPWVYQNSQHEGNDPDSDFEFFDDRPLDMSEGTFSSAVHAVPNDDQFDNRSTWLTFGASIHHQSRGHRWGLDLFHEFSARWKSGVYDPENTDSVWHSFKLDRSGRNVTGRFVIKLAVAAGWREPVASNLPIGDMKAGRAFAAGNRDKLLYVSAEKTWQQCVDGHWSKCLLAEEIEAAKNVAEDIFSDAIAMYNTTRSSENLVSLRQANELVRNRPRLLAMTQMAASEPGMAVSARDSFDSDPLLLAVENGVVDLRSNRLMPAQPNMRLSRKAAVSYDPAASCPMFEKALDDIFLDDSDSALLFQQMVGYCLTGLKTDDAFLFMYGSGANGKSMLSHVWETMMGTYATTIAAEGLEKSRNGSESRYDLADLPGTRLIFAKETSAGGVFDDRIVKLFASSDTVRARPIYGRPFTYKPTGKLVIHGNHKPGVTDTSDGFWRRMQLLNFARTFDPSERDTTLASRIIEHEMPGVLNWSIAGYFSWLTAGGFSVSEKMRQERQHYRDDTDHLAEWLEDYTIKIEHGRTDRRSAYQSYRSFCLECGLTPPSDRLFYRSVDAKGFRQMKSSDRFFVGFVLKDAESQKFDGDAADVSGLV